MCAYVQLYLYTFEWKSSSVDITNGSCIELVDERWRIWAVLNADGDADIVMLARFELFDVKTKQLSTLPLLRACMKVYGSCVRSSMLHCSETWPVNLKTENALAPCHAEMRMILWMFDVKLNDISCLVRNWERLEIVAMLHCNKLWQCGHILWKDKHNGTNCAVDYEIESIQHRDRKEVANKDLISMHLSKEVTLVHSKWINNNLML